MNVSNKLPRLAGLMLLFAMFSSVSLTQAAPPLPFQTGKFRREISPEKPLFILWFYAQNDVEKTLPNLEAELKVIPEDLRPYFAVIPVDHMQAPVSDKYYERLNELGIHFFLSATHPTSTNEERYKKYSYCIGRAHFEFGMQKSTGWDSLEPLPQELELAKKYGLYMVYSIEGRHNVLPRVAGLFPEKAKVIRENGDRMIILNRNNSIGYAYDHASELLGAWQSGALAHWGHDTQDFMWHEGGLTKLFGEEKVTRVDGANYHCLYAYPEALFGIEFLENAAMGGSVFYWEMTCHIFHGAPDSPGEWAQRAPCFKNVLIPLMRKMIRERLISTREEVQAQTPVAVTRPGTKDVYRPSSSGGKLFDNLYGPRYDDTKEWLPYSGRYLRLPVLLEGLTNAEDQKRYKQVLTEAEILKANTTVEGAAKTLHQLNRHYPAKARGSSWVVGIGNRWYIANPNANQDLNTDFEIPLSNNQAAVSLSGAFTPHTFAIVKEEAERLSIHLNNYRVDSDTDLYAKLPLGWKKLMEWVNTKYLVNPAENKLRESLFCLQGLENEPRITATGSGDPESDKPFEKELSWDESKKQFSVRIRHNGVVELKIDTRGVRRHSVPADLALSATVTTSSQASRRTLAEMAIDGNDRSSRWEAWREGRPQTTDNGPQTEEWLQVEFREKKTFNRVVLKEYLDRITAYRLEYWNGVAWIELVAGKEIGVARPREFAPVTADKVRVVITKTKPDSFGMGRNAALNAFEVYGQESGLSAAYPVTASDVYEAEEDATLSNGAEAKTNPGGYAQNFFNAGYVQLMESSGSGVRFLVNAPEAGSYRASLRYSRGEWFSSGDGCLNLFINGILLRPVVLPQTGSWTWWNKQPETVILKKGLNQIEFRNDFGPLGACFLDHLQVTRIPARGGNPVQAREMPLAVKSTPRHDGAAAELSGGATLRSDNPGYSGVGCAFLAGVGQAAGFKLNVDQAGHYELSLRYGFPPGWMKEKSRSLTSHINGKKFIRFEFPRWAANDWPARGEGKWATKGMAVWLEKGENRLLFKVEPGDSGQVLLDCVTLAPASAGQVASAALRLNSPEIAITGHGCSCMTE
jgi:hypothetical protein